MRTASRVINAACAMALLCLVLLASLPSDALAQEAAAPTSDEIVDAILSNAGVENQFYPKLHPMTRWERPNLSLWIVGKTQADLARRAEIVPEISRVFGLAGKSVTSCSVITGSVSATNCKTTQRADIIYIAGNEEDLLFNILYLQTFTTSFESEYLAQFITSAHKTFDRGLKCHASVVATDNVGAAGYQYVGAIVANGEDIKFANCNRMLAYLAVGVAPIHGKLGSVEDPPIFSDIPIFVLYSPRLAPGSTRAEIREEAVRSGGEP